MKSIESFSLQRSSNENALKSALLRDGNNTDISIHGYQITEQFESEHYYILFANYDCPFEESCEITILNRQLKPVGHKSIGVWYQSFSLESVESLGNDEFRLVFYKDTKFQLFVNYPRKFRWTFRGWQTFRLKNLSD